MIKLEPEMLRYLGLQRPSYSELTVEEAQERFQQQIEKFLSSSSIWLSQLPHKPLRVIDIGSGLGFATLALAQHLNYTGTYHALDKSEIAEKIYYGYRKEACAYNDLSLTRRFLLGNGIPTDCLYVHDIAEGFPSGVFDLVISHISWGFHYPVSTYLENILTATEAGSIVYLDIRTGTNGVENMERFFTPVWSRPLAKGVSTAWLRQSLTTSRA